ncbi:hypothetical protein QR685DRAFT_131507 [Neurospora intermedia]|uniref:Uncharacterized protein n=1 Tax=Neurospora intermedia TaxID=5142 RepID=A0ABR3CYJ9_NEUIN
MSQAFRFPAGPAKIRTLYIRVKPAPTNLAERRAVLRALSQHGNIDMFKQLYDSSSFISVASSQNVAASIVRRSPLQFDVLARNSFDPRVPDSIRLPPPIDTSTAVSLPSVAATGTIANSNSKPGQTELNPQQLPQSPSSSKLSTLPERDPTALVTKTFVLEVFPAPEYPHKEHIRMSPLYGPWPRDDSDPSSYDTPTSPKRLTLTSAALRASVPQDMAYTGLHDWESAGQDAMDVEEAAAIEEGISADSATMVRTWRAFWRERVDKGDTLQYKTGTTGAMGSAYSHIMKRKMKQENKKNLQKMLSI